MHTTALLSVPALVLAGRSAHMQQYTRWNIVLLAVSFLMPSLVPPESVLVSSITTVLGFQHGATDGTKLRLLQCHKRLSTGSFLALDVLFHVVPVFVSSLHVGSNSIQMGHVVLVYVWFLTYYTTVVGGFDSKAQYVVHPWKRQVLVVAFGPALFKEAWNHSCVVWFVIAAIYVKEWYDLNDSINRTVHKG